MRQMKIAALKIATWNVNSLKVRLPQVLDWLHDSQTDVLCLQELKLAQEHFPQDAFAQAGYAAYWAGQKTYNGVAVVVRAALLPPPRQPRLRWMTARYSPRYSATSPALKTRSSGPLR